MKKTYHKFEVDAVGFKYRVENDELDALEQKIKNGNIKCTLEPEPENEFDPFAVKVLQNGKHLAYVARASARPLSKLLKKTTVFKCELISFDRENASGRLEIALKE